MDRRGFIGKLGAGFAMAGLSGIPMEAIAKSRTIQLTVLHTNDFHSRLDPFPMDGSRYQGLGGVTRRAALIKKIRSEEKNVLLLDCGDILQGTPYFNLFNGQPEFLAMNEMKYDYSAIGNHDFDAGIERLAELAEMADFEFLCCNYDFSDTPMRDLHKPFKIIKVEGIKIGLVGLGIGLEGLVAKDLYGNTAYKDPVVEVQKIADYLVDVKKCNYVICLSHLGYEYSEDRISDFKLAQKTKNINLILGGHTHTFLDEPVVVSNIEEKPVLIGQVGWAGVKLGRFDILFLESGEAVCNVCTNEWVGKYFSS